jgi:hypothetical protein
VGANAVATEGLNKLKSLSSHLTITSRMKIEDESVRKIIARLIQLKSIFIFHSCNRLYLPCKISYAHARTFTFIRREWIRIGEAIINYERKVIKKPFIQCKLFAKKRPLNLFSLSRVYHESSIIALVAINLHSFTLYTDEVIINLHTKGDDDWKICSRVSREFFF